MLLPADFNRRFLYLILLAWMVPPVFGLGFILFIRILSPEQMLGILLTPLEPLYILGWLGFAIWHFTRYMHPLSNWLADSDPETVPGVLDRMRGFPLQFWSIFLIYLLLAPSSVILSAEFYTDFVARPVDWFRIHLVALIVSILVGLPIFFLFLDLFGRTLGDIAFTRPHVTIKTKVFLIGALVPLLIDTMLVQYYWTRTHYFTLETFFVWLALELLAIAGSLVFVRSISQSMSPLQSMIGNSSTEAKTAASSLVAMSTDELGVLANGYRQLLHELHIHNEILSLNNHLLRCAGETSELHALLDAIVGLCQEAIGGDRVFLILEDEASGELLGVSQTGSSYNPQGHFRLSPEETSLVVWVHQQGVTAAVDDATRDPRVSPRMLEQFKVCSALATPLRSGVHSTGVLMSVSHRQGHHYSKRNIQLMEGLAHEAALAITAVQLNKRRREAERAKAKRDEHYRRLVESTSAIPWELDVESWRFTYIGSQAVKLLGYPIEAWYTENFWAEHIHPDDTSDTVAYCHAAVARREDHEIEYRMLSSDGRTVWIRDEVNVALENGQVTHLHGFMFDISKRAIAEQELRRHREELEARVTERTAELTAVNEELESFSYSVSHDLRGPLRAIDGYSRALMEDYADVLGGEGSYFLERVCHNVARMAELIDDLLKLSRIGRAEFNTGPVDLALIAGEVMDALRETQPQRQVKFELRLKGPVQGDKRLLRAALENLLDNAWKYTRDKEVSEITLGVLSDDRKTIYFVKDNGAGFDMVYADKLFGPFQRLHRHEEFEGTGIGLATVSRIIQRHGGRIWAEGEVGKGATFYFTLGKPPTRPLTDSEPVFLTAREFTPGPSQ